MKVTLIGHATMLVEMAHTTCIMDPVFFDPFEDGAVTSAPKRRVDLKNLPKIDVVIISHRHPDHFDIRSLAMLPRDVDVLIPEDEMLAYACEKLGFARIHQLQPFKAAQLNGCDFLPTPSQIASVNEFGMVFRDSTGVVWNQVDSDVERQDVEAVRKWVPQIDVMFAMYACQNFAFFETRDTRFPYEAHAANLSNVIEANPRLVVPGSAGFRFTGDHAWLNPYTFPIDRGRFLGDLNRMAPDIETFMANPGDIIEVNDGAIQCHEAASRFVVTLEDEPELQRFDPTAPIPPLSDPNTNGHDTARLQTVVEDMIGNGFKAWAATAYDGEKNDSYLGALRDLAADYAIGVVFPGGDCQWYQFSFGEDRLSYARPEVAPLSATIVHKIAASALVGFYERTRHYYYVRAYSRRYTTHYELFRDANQVRAEPRPFPDLLIHYLTKEIEGWQNAGRDAVDQEISRLKDVKIRMTS